MIMTKVGETYSRHWYLTYYLGDNELLSDVFDKVDSYMAYYINSHFAIGNEEFTSTDKRHCHISLSFKSAIGFGIIKKNFPSCHIERTRALKESLVYLSKCGCFYSNYEESNSAKEDIYKDFVNDVLYDMSLRELIKKYPQFFMRNFNNTISLIKCLKGIDIPYEDKDSKIKYDNFL